MKIRSMKYALLALGVAVTLSSCRNDIIDTVSTDEVQLKVLPSIREMGTTEIHTRAGGTSFFEDGDEITVTVTTNRAVNPESNHLYKYTAGTFEGDFFFRPDMTYITELVALWPADGSPGRQEVITDQRKYVDYKQANRLKAEADANNIMPTAAPVPLLFKHEQSRITYRLAGQNANGLIIKELLLELDDERPDPEGLGKKGFWAYCGDGTEDPEEVGKGALNARMILPSDIQFGPNLSDGGRMRVGLVTVGTAGTAANDYRGLIYIPNSTHIILKENTDYLVTLTPEGYDLYATITVGGFSQSEGHVAVPYQLPIWNATTDKYDITTVAQLVTVSWLLSSETFSPEWDTATDWAGSQFSIAVPIVVSDKVRAEADRYLKVSVLKTNIGKFENTDNATYSDGTKVFD
ncbi:fimbrillin family protein [Proteiniphilum sp. UBA5384]|uniref:fimbrillin family protein n=1 Tax=Proteiniphilum sp. UBA5384 TaxID=1947279 RepID=UPI0025D40A50|nr:fimbrillin family protein [Proteiniphilum sp. UBA5384]